MEPLTVLVLGFQLLALFSIAGALLIYLICKVREDSVLNISSCRPSRVVLVTSADTALGLQLCTHLASKGCRVFAGMKETSGSLPSKLLSGWMKIHEYSDEPINGTIIPIKFDVTREDVLLEAAIAMGAHLNADENGIAALINTSGCVFRGRIESQDLRQWENMLKVNTLGTLRLAKAFVNFLRPTRGRFIYLGGVDTDKSEYNKNYKDDSGGLAAFNASRIAVEKCVEELRKEFLSYDVSIVALDTFGLRPESLYKPPTAQITSSNAPTQYTANVLNASALHIVERALWDYVPQERYTLLSHNKYQYMFLCRSSLRSLKLSTGSVARKVQNV